jgi:FkbM family methyltransferase
MLLARAGLTRFLTAEYRDIRLRVDRGGVGLALWIDPDCLAQDVAFLDAYLRPGDLALDVGANVGFHALVASGLIGPSGRVIAVEPHPRTFRRLRQHIALNGRTNIEPRNVAVGRHPGTVRFSDRSLDDSQNRVLLAAEPDALEVPVARLDDLPLPDGPIALLKIDVEGSELAAFEGAPETLARTACVYFEAWSTHAARYGYAAPRLWRLLRDHGFEVYRFDGPGRLTAVAPDDPSDRVENYVAVRDELAFRERTGSFLGR